MSFKSNLINNVIAPNGASSVYNAIAEVISYNEQHNMADVFVSHLKGTNGGQSFSNVPVQLSSPGVHSSALRPGEFVYLQFNNGSLFQPKITGKADELYATHTKEQEKHMRKGALLASQEYQEGETTPSSKEWLDEANTNYFKSTSYKEMSAIQSVSNKISRKGQFNNREVGLFNPVSSSIMKVQDNGVIDIFVSTNVGVRINPQNRTIEMLGDTSTKSDRWAVLSNSVEIQASDVVKIATKNLELDVENITRNGEQVNV